MTNILTRAVREHAVDRLRTAAERVNECDSCSGDGTMTEVCDDCDGVGDDPNDPDERCESCNGDGNVEFACDYCHGDGTRVDTSDLDDLVPVALALLNAHTQHGAHVIIGDICCPGCAAIPDGHTGPIYGFTEQDLSAALDSLSRGKDTGIYLFHQGGDHAEGLSLLPRLLDEHGLNYTWDGSAHTRIRVDL